MSSLELFFDDLKNNFNNNIYVKLEQKRKIVIS